VLQTGLREGPSALSSPPSAALASAAVAGFTTGVNSPTCSHSGGKHGYGKVIATAHFEESGGTGTNYFASIASVQKWSGSHWAAWSPKSTRKSTTFPQTTLGHFVNIGWKYSFVASEAGHTFRLKLVYQFWDQRGGPDRLIASFTRFGPAC